jgi:B-box zinc finger
MRVHSLRDQRGRIYGIALTWGGAVLVPQPLPAVPREPELWRVCDQCGTYDAKLFCRTHAMYLCPDCATATPHVWNCTFLSYAEARYLADATRTG